MRCSCYLFMIALAAISGALAGCSGPAKTETVATSEMPVKTTLMVYSWQDEETNIGLLEKAFEEKYPDIDVSIQFLPISEYPPKMMAIKKNGDQADCIFFPTISEAMVWQNKEILNDISARMTKEQSESLYGKWFDDELCTAYMVPYRMSRWGVYYNQDLFDKRNIPYPSEDWTWEDYADIAVALTKTYGDDPSWGSVSFEPTSTWWRVPARTAGANNPLIEEDLEKFKKAAKWNYELSYERKGQTPYIEQTGIYGARYEANFLEGDIGMFFSGDWSVANLNQLLESRKMDFRYDIAPLPHWQGEESWTIADAAVISMVKNTGNEDASWKFIEFVTGREGAYILAKNQIIPALNTQEVKELYLSSEEYPKHREYFFREGKISSVPSELKYSEAMEIVKDEVAQYLSGEKSLDYAFMKIKKELEVLR